MFINLSKHVSTIYKYVWFISFFKTKLKQIVGIFLKCAQLYFTWKAIYNWLLYCTLHFGQHNWACQCTLKCHFVYLKFLAVKEWTLYRWVSLFIILDPKCTMYSFHNCICSNKNKLVINRVSDYFFLFMNYFVHSLEAIFSNL